MTLRSSVLFFALVLASASASASFLHEDAQEAQPISGKDSVYEPVFSQQKPISPVIVQMIASANTSVYVAARTFVSKPVSEALSDAKRSGKDVKIVLDHKSNATPYSAAQFLTNMSNPPNITKGAAGIDSTYMVIDGRDVIIGDIASAEDKDDEAKTPQSVLIVRNAPELAKRYLADWQVLWNGSEVMKKEK